MTDDEILINVHDIARDQTYEGMKTGDELATRINKAVNEVLADMPSTNGEIAYSLVRLQLNHFACAPLNGRVPAMFGTYSAAFCAMMESVCDNGGHPPTWEQMLSLSEHMVKSCIAYNDDYWKGKEDERDKYFPDASGAHGEPSEDEGENRGTA